MDLNNRNRLRTIKNLRNEAVIADQCLVARTYLMRAKGLIGRRELVQGEGLLLSPCNSIHMWFMSVWIDVVFLKKRKNDIFEVTSTYQRLAPWRLLPVTDLRAHDTLELPSGAIQLHPVLEGDLLCLS